MIALMLGAVLISFSSVMIVLAGLPPDVAGFYRLMGGGLAMMAVLAWCGRLNLITRRILKWGLVGGLFYAGDFFFWHRCIGYVGPGMATMLGNFQVIPLTLLSVFLLKERLAPIQVLAIPLALAGLYLMVGVEWHTFSADFQLGVFFGLLTALFYALYLFSLKYSLAEVRADPLVIAATVAVITGAILGSLALAQGESFIIPSLKSLAAISALALFCHAVGCFLIARGMQCVSGAATGLILLLQPVLSYVWDILLFAKPLNWLELSGVAAALSGIYIGSLRSRK
ncbi:MAG: DMT family transporter [Desulfovibrionaceae bacterium]|nr:DMT family transporter [Desulfovibrionaceae bacterium]